MHFVSIQTDRVAFYRAGDCRPARAQFLGLAAAWRRVVAHEAAVGRLYAWVLKIRGDQAHARPLPPVAQWDAAPQAIYLDGVAWQRPCSHGRSHARAGTAFVTSRRIARGAVCLSRCILRGEGVVLTTPSKFRRRSGPARPVPSDARRRRDPSPRNSHVAPAAPPRPVFTE